MLEEILSLTRDNQKILRKSEDRSMEEFEGFARKLERILNQNTRNKEYPCNMREFYPLMFEELFRFTKDEMGNEYRFLLLLSFYRSDFPWIYELGKHLFDVLKSSKSNRKKEEEVHQFRHMVELTYRYSRMANKEYAMYYHDLRMVLDRILEEL